ncbi:PREDICTED: heavy metal-associated isoprenylated plant protein 5-like isoform X2 [Ipomoea nil]|uniref:heavy metal-associated isoprenylated plant protein 5-like isoform X2 n=1 Tax=Ipomoea nil TaxID=35883 RepID=UPI0009008F7E|nr:PREDICTED: heavy metal-associated isoprenylated plant protein 5-like isoform X2 [Ipomoea nil]
MGEKEETKKDGAENKNEGGDKKGGGDAVPAAAPKAEKKEDGPPPVVLKLDLHCEGCAKKVRRSIRHVEGVEEVKADWETGKVTVKGNVDPITLRDRVVKKTKKQVVLVSPQPKPAAAADKKSDDKPEKAEEKKPKEPQVSTVVMKIRLHCDGCAHKIKRIIKKFEGVEDVTVDSQKDLVTAKGTMDVKELTAYLSEKLKRSVEVAPPKKDDGAGGEKKAKEGGGGEKKKEGGGDEKKADGGGEAAKAVAAEVVNKMEYGGFHPNTYYVTPMYNQSYHNQDYGLMMHHDPSSAQMGYAYAQPYPRVPPPPPPSYINAPPAHMFSDEDPNACSVM